MNTNRLVTRSSVLLSIVGSLLLLVSQGASALTGAHNFGTESCSACHTPHNSDASAVGAAIPLWRTGMTNAAQTYTTYSSSSLAAANAPTAGNVNALSRACLSCHDGVTTGKTVTTHLLGAGNAANLGTALGNDHPISMTYNNMTGQTTGVDTGVNVSSTAVTLISGASTVGALLRKATPTATVANQVECSSCHEVHGANTTGMLLRAATGTLCAACHNK